MGRAPRNDDASHEIAGQARNDDEGLRMRLRIKSAMTTRGLRVGDEVPACNDDPSEITAKSPSEPIRRPCRTSS
jgi:hypothetical protein